MMLHITRLAVDGAEPPYTLRVELEGTIHAGPLGPDIVRDLQKNLEPLNEITFRERSMIEDMFMAKIVRPYLKRKRAAGEIADIDL